MSHDITRRDILLAPGVLAPALRAGAEPAAAPWYRGIQRCGQTNMNERDLAGIDVEAWAEYWASLKLDVVLLNAGGIVAYYPTRVPYHHRSQFLGQRDVLGEFIAAVKKRGIRVMARMDPNFSYEDALKARPEWFQRTPLRRASPRPAVHLAIPHVPFQHLVYRADARHHPGSQRAL